MHRKYLFVLVNLVAAFLVDSDRVQAAGFAFFATRPSAVEEAPSLLKQEISSSRVVGNVFREFRIKPEVKTPVDKFFAAHAKDFNLRDIDGLAPAQTIPDNLIKEQPRVVTHFQQLYKNLPVMGAGYILHGDSEGNVVSGTGRLATGFDIDTTPAVSEDAALEAAKRAVPSETKENGSEEKPRGKLVITFKDFKKMTAENARLAWQFNVSHYRVEVDAHPTDLNNPEILNKIDNRMYNIVPWNQNTTTVCNYVAEDGGTHYVPVCDLGTDNEYRLMCQTDISKSCDAPIAVIDGRSNPSEYHVFVDEDSQNPPIFGEDSVGNEKNDRVGADLYNAMIKAVYFFFNNFSWSGLDGSGKTAVIGYVKNLGDAGERGIAYFDSDPASNSLSFDATKAFLTNDQFDISRINLISTHELVHGIINAIWGDKLVNSGEMASLNESFADIFGNLERNSYLPQSQKPAVALDAFQDPHASSYPTTYKGLYYVDTVGCNAVASCYRAPNQMVDCVDGTTDPHCNSAFQNEWVQNFMFFLLSNGGSGTNDDGDEYDVSGIGDAKASQIAFRTIKARLLPASTYSQARWAWEAAAADIYGSDSPEAVTVGMAWDAVGVSAESNDGSITPQDGDQEVTPWPVNFQWPVKPSEAAWQVQISKSPQFDKNIDPDMRTSDEITDAAGPSSPIPQNSPNFSDGTLFQRDTTKGAPLPSPSKVTPAHSWYAFNLEPDTNYYWRIRAKTTSATSVKGNSFLKSQLNTSQDWGPWSSPPHYFKTEKVAVKLLSPNQTTDAYPWGGASFEWTPVANATQYYLAVTEAPSSGVCPALESPDTKGSTMQKIQGILQKGPLGLSLNEPGIMVKPGELSWNGKGDTYTYKTTLKVSHDYCYGVLVYGPDHIEGNWSNGGQGQLFETSRPQAQLIAPANGAKLSPWDIELTLKKTKGASAYDLRVFKGIVKDAQGNDQGTEPLIVLNNVTGLTTKTSVDYQKDGTGPFYAMATPKGPAPDHEDGLQSEAHTFTVDPSMTKPELFSPNDGITLPYKFAAPVNATCPSGGYTFSVKPVDKASSYKLFFYTRSADGSCPDPAVTAPFLGPFTAAADARNKDGNVVPICASGFTNTPEDRCWRVQAMGPSGQSGTFSDARILHVGLDTPVISNPIGSTQCRHDLEDASVDSSQPLTFQWYSELHPGGYKIDFYESTDGCNPNFNSPLINGLKTSAQNYPSPTLKPDTSYVLNVSALKADGTVGAVGVSHFKTTKPACDKTILPSVRVAVSPCPSKDSDGDCTGVPQSVNFSWPAVTNAKSYILTVDSYSTNEIRSVPVGGTTLPYTLPHYGGGYAYEYIVYLQPVNGCGVPTPTKDAHGNDNVPGTIFTTLQQ